MRQRLIVASRPLHGLGNRVRLVLSGQSLAHAELREFSYYWPTGSGFGARFTDLWAFQDSISRVAELAIRARAPFRDAKELMNDPGAQRLPIWHICSGSALPLPVGAGGWHETFATLPLRPKLAEAVRQLHRGKFNATPYVGVMVRTHPSSHELTKLHSPLSWYVERMHELNGQLGGVRFYLSCDTTEAELVLRRLYPSAVSLPKTGTYNSREAIIESVIDLYLLASSSHILGPHHSSFPELAHLLTLGQVPLETSVGESFARVRPELNLTIAPDPVAPRLRIAAGLP